MIENQRLQQNYQRLAYMVIRDASAFYFGIPEFFRQNANREEAVESLVTAGKTIEEANQIIDKRTCELKEDFKQCLELLTHDNLWYQLLGLNPEIYYSYLNNLSAEEQAELAVVPKWTTQDYSLGRPYITDKFTLNARTNSPSQTI